MILKHIRERTSAFSVYLLIAATLISGGALFFVFHHADAGGLLGSAHHYSTGNHPLHPVMGDFNNDGHLDVAVANLTDNTATISFGNGTGVLTAPPSITLPTPMSGVTSMLAYDFNHDGYAELAISSMGVFQVYDGVTLGTVPPFGVAVPTTFTDMAVGDFNADGVMDVVAIQNSGVVDILTGTGGIGFVVGGGPFPSIPTINPLSFTAITVGNFDAGSPSDGGLDFAVTDQGNDAAYVFLHTLAGTGFNLAPILVVGGGASDILSANFDAGSLTDHGLDLAILNSVNNSITIFMGNGNGTFMNYVPSPDTIVLDPSVATPTALVAGNFDGMNENDAGIDLAVIGHSGGLVGFVSVVLGDGYGNFVQQLPQTIAGNAAVDITSGDLDSDTYPDIVSTNGATSDVSVLLGSPAVINVRSTMGTYGAGGTVPIWVEFNKNIFPIGTPALQLQVGGSTVSVPYSGTSTSTDMLFNYVVSPGDTTSGGFLDYSSITSLTGVVEDTFGDPSQLTLRTVGGPRSLSQSQVIIDGAAPNETISFAIDGASVAVPNSGSTASTSITFNYFGSDDVGGSGMNGFLCDLDGGGYTVCTASGGTGSISYSSLGLGLHTFSVKARDLAGNIDSSPAVWTWSVTDGTSPDTTITSAVNGSSTPVMSGGATNSSTMTFGFSGTDDIGGSGMNGFVCDLDGGGYSLCGASGGVGTITYTSLSIGPHAFSVKARDVAGNFDLSPDTWSWTVTDGVPPDTTISSAVDGLAASIPSAGSTTSSTITFSFSGTDNVGGSGVDSFLCDLDSAGPVPCALSSSAGTKMYTGLSVGTHTFSVSAVDLLGNIDASPDAWIWSVTAPGDVLPPDTIIDTTVDGGSILILNGGTTTSTTLTFSYSGTDELSGSGMNGFFCDLDGGGYSLCTLSGNIGAEVYNDLPLGVHTFSVKARDNAGNSDLTPAVWVVTITSSTGVVTSSSSSGGHSSGHAIGPWLIEALSITTPTTNHRPSYAFSSTESGVIRYSGACTSRDVQAVSGLNTVTFEDLPDGIYPNCMIIVTDLAGHSSNVLTVKSFTITSPVPEPEPTPTVIAPWQPPTVTQKRTGATTPPAPIENIPPAPVENPLPVPTPSSNTLPQQPVWQMTVPQNTYVPPTPAPIPDPFANVSTTPVTITPLECPPGTGTSFGRIVVDAFSWTACKISHSFNRFLSR